jgi:type VI secretion system protein ImpK
MFFYFKSERMFFMNNIPSGSNKESLPEIASDILILIIQLRSSNDFGDPDILKNKIIEMLDKFERRSRNASIDNEKIRLAKFALAAFLDESIISSSWSRKDSWLSEPIQLKLFDTYNAGEEFFTNLESLRQRTGSNRDILEIYYLCLALGFKGKYQLQSPENLRRVIDDLNMELHPDMYKAVEAVSPHAKPRDGHVYSSGKSIPYWVYPAAAIVIIIAIEFFFSYMISGDIDSSVSLLNNLF